jgi:predicted small secreted protein
MKKLSLVVLLGLALSAVLTGCNQSDSGSGGGSTTPAATNAPASTNAP